MKELENVVLAGLNYTPSFYKSDVGDCILCIPKDKIGYTQDALNSFSPLMHFTVVRAEQHLITFCSNMSYYSFCFLASKGIPNMIQMLQSSIKTIVVSLTDGAIKLAHTKNRT